jgi:aldose 1-epimerase
MFRLKNDQGMSVSLMQIGATIYSIKVPDKNGHFDDVTLGLDHPEDYGENKAYFGCIVGRYGNRISKGKVSIDGKEYQLSVNDGANHLHGGLYGFNKMIWRKDRQDKSCVKLVCHSMDGDQGYPGNVVLSIKYSLSEENELKIEFEGKTDKTTILNPTNHSYFNLAGQVDKSVLNHEVQIFADSYTPVSEDMIPTGEVAQVKGTPMDFSSLKRVGQNINEDFDQLNFARGYDHNFVLKNSDGKVRKVAEVYNPENGRLLEVLTDQPGVQFYTGNWLKGIKGKNAIKYRKHAGLCLETQGFPDAPNNENFPSTVLHPDEVYKQTTIYKFSIR